MSRLYTSTRSDRRETPAMAGAYEETITKITWGNADNPKTVVHTETVWGKGSERPTVYITIGQDVDVIIWGPDGKRVFERKQ